MHGQKFHPGFEETFAGWVFLLAFLSFAFFFFFLLETNKFL